MIINNEIDIIYVKLFTKQTQVSDKTYIKENNCLVTTQRGYGDRQNFTKRKKVRLLLFFGV